MPDFQRDPETRVHYDVLGQGQPLLLIHGFMGTGGTEFGSLVAWLARRYRLILPDLQGYGRSTPKPRTYPVNFYQRDATDLVALLEHLAYPRVSVLGYSDGGEIGLWLPLLAPERISGVVTWGATGHFDASIRPAVMAMLGMG
ncbi:MAG: alpha/beta fold hydrolase, partial [Anaerolineae bacterium]|nr:alpha/beta fold hydrolase [Anaerolineae bacterium]